MAYSKNSPPRLMTPAIPGAGGAMWLLDLPAFDDVTVPGYITNGAKLGMQLGDLVRVRYGGVHTDGCLYTVTDVQKSTATGDGPATLSN